MPSNRVKPAIMSPVLEYPEDMNPFGDDEETEVGTPKIESPKVGTPKIQSPKVQTPGYYLNLILGLFLTASYTLLVVQGIALLSISLFSLV